MFDPTRPCSRRVLFNVSLLSALLLAGFAGLSSLARSTGAVDAAPSSKAEKASRSASSTPAPKPIPSPASVTNCQTSRWLAEGNANDSNGLNPQGILKNGATFAPGAAGQAFSLDGSNDYVEAAITTGAMNSPVSFTWEACIYPTSLVNRKPVVFSKEFGTGNRAGLQINSNGSLCSYMNSGQCAETSAPGIIATNKFTKVTLLYDGSTKKLVTYVDGSPLPNPGTVLTPYNNSAPFIIGRSTIAANTYFLGLIDEVTFSACAVPPSACGCGPSPTPIP